jgi:murein DD-endopeptidase MepM/ murein hydrolase activator NlpD
MPIPGTGTIYPTVAEYEAWARDDGSTVEIWASTPLYAAPVGTDEERASGNIWPGQWVDATGYLTWYFDKWWHTGADLNLNEPTFDADAHAPVYAIADGEVYAVRNYSGWDNVICVRHEHCLSRYAHGENLQVREGESVKLGDHLMDIGDAAGGYPYHLHFDIARLSARMAQYPGDWPGADKERVLRDYNDPKLFLVATRRGYLPPAEL